MRRSAVRELLKLTASTDCISLAGGLPAPELFPIEQIREATEKVLKLYPTQALQYGSTEGVASLRDWIATRFSQPGRPLTRENVLITTGAQQGIDLIGRVFLNPGDRVAVENPTYLATLTAWRPLEAEFIPLPSDDNGMQVDALGESLTPAPKLLYCVPNFQNPTGRTLGVDRRERLLEYLRGKPTILVEDNPYGDLRYEGAHQPHFVTLEGQRNDRPNRAKIIYLGTFSKVTAPGFRVGWVVADTSVIDKLVLAKQAADLHTSSFNQLVLDDLVRSGILEFQLPRLIQAYGERCRAMLAALKEQMPAGVTWSKPEGGMFVFVTLPRGIDASIILKRALEEKVAFVPGEEFHVRGEGKNTLRLNFTHADPDRLREGIRRLAKAFSATLPK